MAKMKRVVAIVLAAGEGRRMGGPKALLRIEGETCLARCVRGLRRPRVERVVAVLGCDASRVRREGGALETAEVVVNERWRDGMLGSVHAGLEAASEADAVLLHPVDSPFVEAATVDAVLDALEAGARIAVPSHGRRRGHPAGFAREAFPALAAAPPERGARAVLEDHPQWVVHVDAGPSCLADLDRPEDLAKWGSLSG
jgi:CTP:molybdopterin cytidylyltransferase MocA